MERLSRVARWLHCAQKSCCSFSYICVTGDDVARIARALSLEPWYFTIPIPAPHDADDGFALDGSGLRFRLALKRTSFARPNAAESCAFLARLADGTARCGLGALRPAVCRVFPARVDGDAIVLQPAGCTCDWSGVTFETETLRELTEQTEARERYADVVRRWNAFVLTQGATASFSVRDFDRFLLDAYGE